MARFRRLLCLLPLCGLIGCSRWVEAESTAAETEPVAVTAVEDGSPSVPAGPRTDSSPPADLLPSDARRVLTAAAAAYRTKLAVIADNLANADTRASNAPA